MKNILYHTVIATTAAELDKSVSDLLDEGYQLYGSPYSINVSKSTVVGDMEFCQAMTLG